ncbi:FecR family protein [Zhouia sp. PK063]|uniref:FecR family protein n=1 Tax=Zhouia sp. PK063 TaxID=3373602 RepID=UPI0037A1B6A2
MNMNYNHIKILLHKYTEKSATVEDLDQLNEWVKDPAHKPVLKEYLTQQYIITMGVHEPNSYRVKKHLLDQIRKEKKSVKRRKTLRSLSYAALLAIILGLSYYFYQSTANHKSPTLVDNSTIILQNEDGTFQQLADSAFTFIMNKKGEKIAEQIGKKLIYNNNSTSTNLAFNTIKVPYGKQFSIELSDGTLVKLNAGSQLKYPIAFKNNGNRDVYLKGEGYFDVKHDPMHPFIVASQNLNVKVLGTAFNVSDYEEDKLSEVVLVRGSVRLKSVDDKISGYKGIMLTPGDQAVYTKAQHSMKTKKVNTDVYTSWINGYMVFRNISFDMMLKKLERHYNVQFENHNVKLANEKFNATIDLENDSINEVLVYFNKIYGVNYTVNNNKIIIE